VKVFYWPGFTGRSEPILALLTHMNQEYELSSDVMGMKKNHPNLFACPIYDDGATVLSQTVAIMFHLGKKYNLMPANESEALKVSLDLADIWAEAYNAKKSFDDGKSFCEGRLGMWLDALEAGAGKSIVGDLLSFVDFQASNVFYCLTFMFGDEFMAKTLSLRHKLSAALAAVNKLSAVQKIRETTTVLYPAIRFTQ